MYSNKTIESLFEAEKNKKALTYTAVIVLILLLLAVFFTWPVLQPKPVVVQDLIEINLGNNEEGFGAVQPLIKGRNVAFSRTR